MKHHLVMLLFLVSSISHAGEPVKDKPSEPAKKVQPKPQQDSGPPCRTGAMGREICAPPIRK